MVERGALLDELLVSLMGQALVRAQEWPAKVFLAFNVSPKQFRNADLAALIANAADAVGFPLSRIHVEITETAIIEDEDRASAILQRLSERGCHIVIDDFGTGYSSLAWLQKLPVSKVKIDTTFVGSMLERKDSRKIVTAIVGLGHSLGLAIVAEGVETEQQADFLRRIGCGFAQGYLFGRACPAAAVPALLKRFPHRAFDAPRVRMSLEQRAYQISALYRGGDVAIGFLDADGVLVDGSQSFLQRLGVSRDSAIGSRLEDLDSANLALVQMVAAHRNAERSHSAAELDLPAGRTDFVIAQDVRDEVGEPIGVSVFAVDITESKRVREELREQEHRFRFVTENCPHAFWIMSPSGELIFTTAYWEKLSGVSRKQVEDGEVGKFIDPEHRDLVMSRWRHCLATGLVFDMDYRHRLADGDLHWVRCWGAPHRDGDGVILAWYGTFSVIHPPRAPFGEQVPNSRHLGIIDGDRVSALLRLASLLRISADVLSELYEARPDLSRDLVKVAAAVEKAAVASLS